VVYKTKTDLTKRSAAPHASSFRLFLSFLLHELFLTSAGGPDVKEVKFEFIREILV
jgi:hypothetical protein